MTRCQMEWVLCAQHLYIYCLRRPGQPLPRPPHVLRDPSRYPPCVILCLGRYSRICCYRLWYKWFCRVAGSCSLGNECRRIESLSDQPHPYEHLPQAPWTRGNQTQTRPHDFRHHPAKNDRVSNEEPTLPCRTYS